MENLSHNLLFIIMSNIEEKQKKEEYNDNKYRILNVQTFKVKKLKFEIFMKFDIYLFRKINTLRFSINP